MVSDILLNVTVVVDILAQRKAYSSISVKFLEKAVYAGKRVWLYTRISIKQGRD